MLYKYQYETEEEKQDILSANTDKRLIEVQNITEGNFLIFSDQPIEKEVVYINVPQNEIEALKQSIAELTLLLVQMGGM